MNKYLYKKIEQAHGAYFENLIFIASEVCRPRTSEAMEEFQQLEFSEICKVFGWRDEKDVHKAIKQELKDEGLAVMLLRNDMTGFLAECCIPQCSDFRTEEGKDRPSSWSVHGGICEVFWIYAESIGELVHKLEIETEKRFLKMYEDFKSEQIAK
jgi:hypothetical protein